MDSQNTSNLASSHLLKTPLHDETDISTTSHKRKLSKESAKLDHIRSVPPPPSSSDSLETMTLLSVSLFTLPFCSLRSRKPTY